MDNTVIKIEHLKKQYRYGYIGARTLGNDIKEKFLKVFSPKKKQEKSKEKFYALDDISFEVKKGEKVAIIGGNGAGKSTLLKLISRITAPTSGDIWIDGKISSILQIGTGFNGELTGRENIFLNGSILGMTKAEIESKIDKIIEFSECEEFIDTPVKRYSSGMFVKLAFSVAAHLNGDILIMDEVLAVGDIKFQNKCLAKLNELATSEGKTILFVSHNMNSVRQLCDRGIVLEKGRMVFDGDTRTAIEKYMNLNRSDALGDYNYKDVKRPVNFAMSGTIDRAFVRQDAKNIIPVEITLMPNDDAENVSLCFVIDSFDGSPIGSILYEKTFSLKKGEEKKISCTLDITNLQSGSYPVGIALFAPVGNRKLGLDKVDKAFIIQSDRTADGERALNPSVFGEIIFPDAKDTK